MRVVCPGIRDGWFEDKYGAKGDVFVNGMPGLSPAYEILGAPEGAAHNHPAFTEGANCWFSALDELTREQATGYGGPAPPNGMHRYTLKVYALDTVLDLPSGFRLNDLMFAMDGHVLAHCKTIGRYSNE